MHLGSVGNKNEMVSSMVWFLVLGVIEILTLVYFMGYQTYVLYLELYAGVISCVFLGFEMIFGIVSIMIFYRESKYKWKI